MSRVLEWFQKRPVRVQAVQYDGSPGCVAELAELTARTWNGDRLVGFYLLGSDESISVCGVVDVRDKMNLGYTAIVYDDSHAAWLGVRTWDWIVKGLKDEFYPCAPDDFDVIYEPVP